MQPVRTIRVLGARGALTGSLFLAKPFFHLLKSRIALRKDTCWRTVDQTTVTRPIWEGIHATRPAAATMGVAHIEPSLGKIFIRLAVAVVVFAVAGFGHQLGSGAIAQAIRETSPLSSAKLVAARGACPLVYRPCTARAGSVDGKALRQLKPRVVVHDGLAREAIRARIVVGAIQGTK